MAFLYEILGLRKSFQMKQGIIEVLKGLDFTITPGEWLALSGRSGSGKTTLLHLLGGLDRPSQGKILLNGQDLSRLPSSSLTALRRTVIGYVFQSYQLFPELSALENAVLPALSWGSDRQDAVRRATALLQDFGLGERLQHRPRELSGGEQQRVAIARSLINNPKVILADEPTGNLDAAAAAEIVAILQKLRQDRQLTIVMVTHDQKIAASADRCLHLADGLIKNSL